MTLILNVTKQFKKDLKRVQKQKKNLQLLKEVKDLLMHESQLPIKYKSHQLIGNYVNHYELHIQPDWLLIYKINGDELIFVRTGSHSELF